MQLVEPFPQWFIPFLSNTPAGDAHPIHSLFKSKLSIPFPSDTVAEDLIAIFGRTNLSTVGKQLPATNKSLLTRVAKDKHEKFSKITTVSLEALTKHTFIDLEKLRDVFPDTIYTGESVKELILREVSTYLLSTGVPSQVAKLSGWNRVELIETTVDKAQKALDDALYSLFFFLAENSADDSKTSHQLTRAQENLLFKRAALYRQGTAMTWGNLLFWWFKESTQGSRQEKRVCKKFCFDKILVPKSDAIPSKDLSFSDFVTEKCIDFLLSERQNVDPLFPLGALDKRLRAIIGQSLYAGTSFRPLQDVISFFDELEQLTLDASLPGSRATSFSFEAAQAKLCLLIPDLMSHPFQFLCRCLYFLHCKALLQIPKAEEPAFLEEVFTLDCRQKKVETNTREPLDYPQLVDLVTKKRLTRLEFAKIVVEYTLPNPFRTSTPSPYLSCRAHLQTIRDAEHRLGIRLPSSLLFDLLFFQTMTKKTVDSLEIYASLRYKIRDSWREAIAIPRDLYVTWRDQAAALIASIEIPRPQSIGDQSYAFPEYSSHNRQLARLVQYGTYPLPFLDPLARLMPVGLNGNQLQFSNPAAEDSAWSFEIEGSTEGPHVRLRWLFLDEKWVFAISLGLADQTDGFTVPLAIPKTQEIQKQFFVLLAHFVDELGKEALNEADVTNFKDARVHMLDPTSVSPYDHGVNVFTGVLEDKLRAPQTTTELYQLGNNDTPEGPVHLMEGSFRIGRIRRILCELPDAGTYQISFCYDLAETRIFQEKELTIYRFTELGKIHHIKQLTCKNSKDWKVNWEKLFYHIPNELLPLQNNPEIAFEGLMRCSPLLKNIWQKHAPSSERHANELKSSLYAFITTFRARFKTAFYAITTPPN